MNRQSYKSRSNDNLSELAKGPKSQTQGSDNNIASSHDILAEEGNLPAAQTTSVKKYLLIGLATVFGILALVLVIVGVTGGFNKKDSQAKIVIVPNSSPDATSGDMPSDGSPGSTSAPGQPTRPPAVILPPIEWRTIANVDFGPSILKPFNVTTLAECQARCTVGCDFYTYQPYLASAQCKLKYTDKTANTATYFKGQLDGSWLVGELRNMPILNTIVTTTAKQCTDACTALETCHFANYDYTAPTQIKCWLKSLTPAAGITTGFRYNPRPQNYDPVNMGRIDIIGSCGIVAIHVNLLPNGKVLVTARPEYLRGGPNLEAVSRPEVPWGEIGTVFDPVTATFVPSQIDDNVFCHGAILMADGLLFMGGGDDSSDPSRAASHGLKNGLNLQRYFNYTTEKWTYIGEMKLPRWYPSPIRVVNGSVFIFGGAMDGNGVQQTDFEVFTPFQPVNIFHNSPILDFTGTAGYPKVAIIPGSGDIWIFAYRSWGIISVQTGLEIEREVWGDPLVHGIRSGNNPAAGVLLPLSPANGYAGEYIMFGGAESIENQTAIDTVARMVISGPAPHKWTYDTDKMPYGRVTSDAVIQPNGKILIFNGAQLGMTGGGIGLPSMFAEAIDVFCYDPYASPGTKFRVFAHSTIRRLYHSNSVYVPDGRTLIMGTDQATYEPTTSFEHRVEAFTPPWLLDGTPRPVITSVPQGIIKYGEVFNVGYTGAATKISIMAPGASTHGTEFTQRHLWPEIVSHQNGQFSIRAPPDATVLIQGYYMIFVLNGDTPSVAQWIRFG